MKPVYQTKFGDPEGNCFAACVASILECDITELPDFVDKPEQENWLIWFNDQIRNTGYAVACYEVSQYGPLNAYIPEGVHFIVAGPGERGLKHCVVMRSNGSAQGFCDDFAHDPFPGGAGLKEVSSICLIVAL